MTTQAARSGELSTNERLAGEIVVLVVIELVLALIMLRLEYDVAINPAGPFGKGHFYEPMFIGMLTLLSALTRLVSATLWCWWLLRVMWVIRDGCSLRLRHGRPWSTVWWLVPGFNLVMPYLAIRELWKAVIAASERRIDEWPSVRVPMFLPVWWGFWAIHLLAYGLVISLSISARETANSTMLLLCIVRDGALLVAAPLAVLLIIKISRAVEAIGRPSSG